MTNLDLKNQDVIDFMTNKVMDLPQADCPVAHYFSPGLYIREVTFPAGIFVIGHKQRYEQLNIFLRGKIAMFSPDGKVNEITAPMTFIGPAGAKMGYVIETAVWQNVYPNVDDQRDIDILEDRWLDKSAVWTEREKKESIKRRKKREEDRIDYLKVITEAGYTEDQVRAESENTDDLIPLPRGLESALTIRNSDIEGKGLFASWPFDQDVIIGPARIADKRTPIGRYVNHSKNPNCEFIEMKNGDIYLRSIRPISGCKGGSQGEEITINYQDSIKIKLRKIQCQALQQPRLVAR